MGVPWKHHRRTMEASWKHHEGTPTDHGNTVEVLWKHHETSIEAPSKHQGSTMDFHESIMRSTMAALCIHGKSTIGSPWTRHERTMLPWMHH